jgi:hypothetical protein
LCQSVLALCGRPWPGLTQGQQRGKEGPTRQTGTGTCCCCCGDGPVALPNSKNLIWKSSRRDPPRARSPTIREKTLQPTQAQLSAAPERVRERLAGGGGGGRGHSSLINLTTGQDRAGGGRPIVLRRSEGPHCGSPSLPHFWRVTLFLNQEIIKMQAGNYERREGQEFVA